MDKGLLALTFILGVVASIFASFIFPFIKNTLYVMFQHLYIKVMPNSINLAGEWEATYEEPDPMGKLISTTEKIKIKQTGSFQLLISADRNTMTGACIWLDGNTDKPVTSVYIWKRK